MSSSVSTLRPILILMSAVSMTTAVLAQPTVRYQAVFKGATRAQINEALKKDPELRSGFKTRKGANVKVVSMVPGGVRLAITADGDFTAAHTVSGPPRIMEKGVLGDIADATVDKAKEVAGKIYDVVQGGGSGEKGGQWPSKGMSCEGGTRVSPNGTVTNRWQCNPA